MTEYDIHSCISGTDTGVPEAFLDDFLNNHSIKVFKDLTAAGDLPYLASIHQSKVGTESTKEEEEWATRHATEVQSVLDRLNDSGAGLPVKVVTSPKWAALQTDNSDHYMTRSINYNVNLV